MYIVLYVCIYIWLNIYIWFLYICVFLVLQALFPQPRGCGDFKEACADFLRAKLWVTCSTLQKGTRLSASVEQIHTDCKEHPTCFWSRTTKGSGLGEGNVWERNEPPSSICLVTAQGVRGTQGDQMFKIASLHYCVLRNQTTISWSSKDNWLTHNPVRLTDLLIKVSCDKDLFLEFG